MTFSRQAKSLTPLFHFALAVALSLIAVAQTATGGLRGVVTDASGAAVPSANVTVKSPSTGVEFKLTSNSEGGYAAPRLLPGVYTVTVEAAGFKKAEFTDITVSLAGIR